MRLCFDANDPLRLASFWAAAVLWEIHEEARGGIKLVPTDGTRLTFLFLPVLEPKVGKNRLHLDFCVVVRGDFLATTDLVGSIVFEPADPVVGRFWSEAAGWPIAHDQDGDTAIRAPDGRGTFVTFGPPTGAVKTGKNRLHLDPAPAAGGDQAAEVERLIALGAQRADIGQVHASGVGWPTLRATSLRAATAVTSAGNRGQVAGSGPRGRRHPL